MLFANTGTSLENPYNLIKIRISPLRSDWSI